jgi:hypothetical protein
MCEVLVHAVKAYRGSRRVPPLTLTSALDGSRFTPGKEPGVHWIRCLWAAESAWMF